MSDKILEAVNQLDPKNDNHWTVDGLPRLETVRMLAGDTGVSREQVEEVAPGFKRPEQAPAPPNTDDGVRGTVGSTPPAPPAPPASVQTGPVPPQDAEGASLAVADPLPAAPAADGLPTANLPTAVEGAPSEGLKADETSGRQGPGGKPVPEISKGTTMQGYNALNDERDDLRDALASVAPSPNAPTTLGGPKEAHELDGTNADGLPSAAELSSEAQFASLDRGHEGHPDALPALEEALAEETARSDGLRAQADAINRELDESARRQAWLRGAIEAATPKTGHMQAVQGYFAAQDKQAEQTAAVRQALAESGIDLKVLGQAVQRSGLDAASAKS